MNDDRRKQIRAVESALDDIKREIDSKAADEETGDGGTEEELADHEEIWSKRIEDLKSDVETAKDDEQDYYDNMPQGLQGGDKGSRAQEAVDALQRVEDDLDELLGVQEVGELTKLFNEKYDDMCGRLQEAAE